MKKGLKRKVLIGSSLSLSALLFACGGGGSSSDGDTTAVITSPYATLDGTITASSNTATGALFSTAITAGNLTLAYIAAIAIEDGKLVYTADDIDDNGNFNLKLKKGLDYVFILFDEYRLPVFAVQNDSENVINVNGDGSLNIILEDTDNNGLPDSVRLSVSGDVQTKNNPQMSDDPNDDDYYPESIETIDYGGTPNPDYDEDGDGYFDGVEDNDHDGYIDGKEDSNRNGIPDVYEDDDSDGLPDYLDDSDGDGYPDHIDEDDSDNYRYEMKGTVSGIDTVNYTFGFLYNNSTYTVSITPDTVCEIYDVYYRGYECINKINDNDYIELKTSDDINQTTNISAVKFELEGDSDSGQEYRYEVYGTITSINPENSGFTFLYAGKDYNVNVTQSTKCEINDVYYYGTQCLDQLQPGMYIELKTFDDIYSTTDITAVELETKKYEIYGFVGENIGNTYFEFVWNNTTYTALINENTECEIEQGSEEYEGRGLSCLDYITSQMCLEIKTYDNIYGDNISEINVVEFETSDDCRM